MRTEQAVAALRFAPLVPDWALAALAVLCVAVLALAASRRARGVAWRALAFAVVLAWLAGPRLVQETRDVQPDIGLLVVDQSGSMALGDRAALRDAARDKLLAEAGRIPGLEMRTVTVPPGSGTPLDATVTRALADIPRDRLAGVVAITDGQATDASSAGMSPALPVPFHALITARGEERDRRLRVIEAPPFGIVGKSVAVRYVVEDLGADDAGQPAAVTVRQDGAAPRTVQAPVGVEQRIELPVTRPGRTLLELQAQALPGEVSEVNNRAIVEVNGVRDRLRVLLVSGEPNPGVRTWRRLLKADPAVDLVHFTILRPPDRNDDTPLNELALIAFPVRELFQVKVRDFDLIILDQFENQGLLPSNYLRNIADYVRDGGALLLETGPEFVGTTTLASTPLADVLPAQPAGVVEDKFTAAVTALGERHPVTEGLPGWLAGKPPEWGPWYRRVAVGGVTGQAVLATPGGAPLLLLDRVGRGRVAMLLSDQIWLWSRGHDGGGPQAELLRRIAHWLMKEPALEEEALTARVEAGRLLVERRTLADGPPGEVSVTAPDGSMTRLALEAVTPGVNRGTMPAAAPGVWRVSDGVHAAFAAAGITDPAEFADLRATASKLAGEARASGGSVRFLGDGAPELRRTAPGRAASGSDWIGLPERGAYVVTGVDATPLLPGWAALLVLLGAVVVAWRREAEG